MVFSQIKLQLNYNNFLHNSYWLNQKKLSCFASLRVEASGVSNLSCSFTSKSVAPQVLRTTTTNNYGVVLGQLQLLGCLLSRSC